jgi:hypothetical protein
LSPIESKYESFDARHGPALIFRYGVQIDFSKTV